MTKPSEHSPEYDRFSDWSKKNLPPVVPPGKLKKGGDPRDAEKPTELPKGRKK